VTEPSLFAEIPGFITARLDEEEKAALAALPADVCCWAYERVSGSERLVEHVPDDDGDDMELIALFAGPGYAEHIALHNPARALQEIEGKREVVRLCALWADEPDVDPNDLVSPRAALARQVLACMALAWGSHPEYKPAWHL
jgi:hypothetical protein